jgi:predicted Ser/Thr protein kinase
MYHGNINTTYLFIIRLDEKLTNLESENKVLRQQALSMTPNKYLSGRSRSTMQVILYNVIY